MSVINGYLIIQWVNGDISAIPMVVVFFFVFALIVGLLIACVLDMEKNARVRRQYADYYAAQSRLPAEITTPQSVDYYSEQTARVLELKKKLDAQTALAESYIRAMRTKGELEELPEILGHDQAKRIARRQ